MSKLVNFLFPETQNAMILKERYWKKTLWFIMTNNAAYTTTLVGF